MPKVTSKWQLTLPKRIAPELSLEERLRLFDSSTRRQQEYEKQWPLPAEPSKKRDWTREELYTRGKAR